jgi:hypothetical protein
MRPHMRCMRVICGLNCWSWRIVGCVRCRTDCSCPTNFLTHISPTTHTPSTRTVAGRRIRCGRPGSVGVGCISECDSRSCPLIPNHTFLPPVLYLTDLDSHFVPNSVFPLSPLGVDTEAFGEQTWRIHVRLWASTHPRPSGITAQALKSPPPLASVVPASLRQSSKA